MNNRNFIIVLIAVILCIIAGTVLLTSMSTVNYERIEITPNATMDVPSNQLKDYGDTLGVKLWKWNNGVLITYTGSGNNSTGLAGTLGLGMIKKLAGVGEVKNIDGFNVYSVGESEIPDSLKMYVKGNIYTISIVNDDAHDNILICCQDKDVALHMAKSVQFK